MGYRVSIDEVMISLEKQNLVLCKKGTDYFSK